MRRFVGESALYQRARRPRLLIEIAIVSQLVGCSSRHCRALEHCRLDAPTNVTLSGCPFNERACLFFFQSRHLTGRAAHWKEWLLLFLVLSKQGNYLKDGRQTCLLFFLDLYWTFSFEVFIGLQNL